jgi:hypothetical protein
MHNPMHILVNDFAIRSFRETADKDYIAARMAYRARLIQPFLWSALPLCQYNLRHLPN